MKGPQGGHTIRKNKPPPYVSSSDNPGGRGGGGGGGGSRWDHMRDHEPPTTWSLRSYNIFVMLS